MYVLLCFMQRPQQDGPVGRQVSLSSYNLVWYKMFVTIYMIIRNICNSEITFDKSKDYLQYFCSEIGPLFDSCEIRWNEFVKNSK